MAAIELSKNVATTGFNETEFKAVGNPLTGALLVELATGAPVPGSSDTLEATQVLVKTGIGAVTETAPATDTASSGLNGRLQRVAAHLTNVVSYTSRLLSSTGPKAAGGALATTALQVGGTHTTVLPTMTDTQEGGLQLDASGRLIVSGTFWQTTQPVSIAAAVVLAGFTPVTITTATTTLVKSGAGLLHGITVNSLGTVASTIEVYDALTATGTPLAIIDSLTLSGQFVYDLNFTTGLTLVTTGTVAPNLTVAYR
jgi:hypothetical protein